MSAATAKPSRQIAVTVLPGDSACIDLVSLTNRNAVHLVIAPRPLSNGQRRVVESLVPRGREDAEAARRWNVALVWIDPHWAAPEIRPEPPFAVRLFFGS